MAKADLHVHSKLSNHPSEWFLKRIGANECYTDPEFIYDTAKSRGMDFVTITDHNKIEGALLISEKYPDAFPGVESTVYFPEDGCKVHVLLYGLTAGDFELIQATRNNIYDFRDIIKELDIIHSVAHATYSVNQSLTIDNLEKLILLFDNFESVNGGRNYQHNMTWTRLLRNLTPEIIERLRIKHGIEPFSENAWQKGFTGGSDDHAGIFIARTWTEVEADSKEEFLFNLKSKRTVGMGRSNDFKGLAFTVYKIAHDFYKSRGNLPQSVLSLVNEMVFNNYHTGLIDKLKIKKLRYSSEKKGDRIARVLADFLDILEKSSGVPIEDKLDLLYENVASITDELFRGVLRSIEEDLKKGDFLSVIKNISASVPGIFLSLPFFTTLKHLYSGNELLNQLKNQFDVPGETGGKRILWFTDTIDDLNGVAVTLKKIGKLAEEKKLDLEIACSVMPDEVSEDIPKNIMNLPAMYAFDLPGYESYNLKVPSILTCMERIYKFNPDEIYTSTPGPMGLLGLLAGKLMNVKTIGVYHTDYKLQVADIIPDAAIVNLIDIFNKWYYQNCDEVKVFTEDFFNILVSNGVESKKIKYLSKGIDTKIFAPKIVKPNESIIGRRKGRKLLYVGRISKEKKLDFMVNVYKELVNKYTDLSFVVVGDGPYLKEFAEKHSSEEGVIIIGSVKREELPEIYSASDLFVFPSVSDTFGLVVLEAQACALPAVVSDFGGPKSVIIDGKTGFVAKANDLNDWTEKVSRVLEMMNDDPIEYVLMQNSARINVIQKYRWNKTIDEIFGISYIKENAYDLENIVNNFQQIGDNSPQNSRTPLESLG